MPPATYSDDVLALVKTGDLDSMSCGFFILAEKWSSQDGQRMRTITQGRLIEVSSVAMPAYSQTSLAIASEDDQDEQLMHDPEDDDLDFDDLDVLATASSVVVDNDGIHTLKVIAPLGWFPEFTRQSAARLRSVPPCDQAPELRADQAQGDSGAAKWIAYLISDAPLAGWPGNRGSRRLKRP